MQNDEGKGLDTNRDKQKNKAQDALTTVTTIGNYLNNLESSRKADGELTNPCVCVPHMVCITVLPL